MAWRIRYLKSARKGVQKLGPQACHRIHDFLEKRVAALENPRLLGRPLKGQSAELWRYRVGDYRIVCELHDDELVVLVIRVGHRRHIYR